MARIARLVGFTALAFGLTAACSSADFAPADLPPDAPGIGDAAPAPSDAANGARDGRVPKPDAASGLDDGAAPDGAADADDAAATDAGIDAGMDSGADAGADAGVTKDPRACVIACVAGEKMCNGHCVAVDDPRYGCGATTCSSCVLAPAHTIGTTTCSAGACLFGGLARTCRAGWASCDGDWSNGCETDLSKPATCGSCTNACAAGQVCDAGTCRAACAPPRDDCGDGSCHDFATSATGCNCKVCPDSGGTPSCNAGACGFAGCDPGYTTCAGKPGCFDTMNDPDHCGASCTVCGNPFQLDPNDTAVPRGRACIAGKCAALCAAGYSSCPSGALNVTCVDLEADPKNCGACAKACATGTTCRAGACVPSDSVKLLTGFIAPADIAVDATNIYFSDAGGPGKIWQVDKTTLGKTQLSTLEGAVKDIAIDDGYVYWTSTAGIRRAPIGGGTPAETLYAAKAPIAVDDTYVYFMDATTGSTLWMAPKAGGGAPVALLTGRKTTNLVAQNGRVFGIWYGLGVANTKTYYVYGVDPNTRAATFYVDVSGDSGMGRSIGALDVDATSIYWGQTSLTSLYLRTGPISTGASATIQLPGIGSLPISLQADRYGCGVFWTMGGNGIWRLVPSVGVPFRVTTAGEQVQKIALDDKYVYWTDSTWIGRVPK